MKRILHILKDNNAPEAWSVIAKQTANNSDDLSIVLIQEAVRSQPNLPAKIYLLEEDAKERGVPLKFETVDYSKMLELILASDAVITW